MDDHEVSDQPVRDQGSIMHHHPTDDDIDAHHTENWQHQAMYVGLNLPRHHKHRHRRRHHHHHRKPKHEQKPAAEPIKEDQEPAIESADDGTKPLLESGDYAHPGTPPAERIQFLLAHDSDDEEHSPHDLFCELQELRYDGEDMEWKEMARWVKFEEDVEEGGERWSKPHVATLSLHSLFELRKGLLSGTVILDADCKDLFEIVDGTLEHMIATGHLDFNHRDATGDVLMARHKHQYQRAKAGMSIVRSMAEIGRKHSSKNVEKEAMAQAQSFSQRRASMLGMPGGPTDSELSRTPSSVKFNEHFLKKLPPGAEAANIMVGEVDFLEQPLMAFLRLKCAIALGDLTEVPISTRFLFMLLGPKGHTDSYHEIGRSIATLMSDEVFHEIAYKARNRGDLVAGIDEFLDQVTVLPPGEWDPNIRIEPPKSVPSQEGRKHCHTEGGHPPSGMPNGMALSVEEEVEEEHGDPTLQRTGNLFGGLIADVKRKIPWYLSDIKDAAHIQTVAAFFFMYFACLTPIITFGGLLGDALDDNMGAMESLISGAVCGISWHIFSGQPLTIIGSTGPVLVFETIIFDLCKDNGIIYMSFRFWIGMWICVALLFMVMFDLSALVRYITRFTEESFALLIALIFIVEAFKKQFHILDHDAVLLTKHDNHTCICSPFINETSDGNGTSNETGLLSTMSPILNFDNSTEQDVEDIDWGSLGQHECKDHSGVLTGPGCGYIPDVFFFSCLLFIFTFAISISLKNFRFTRFLPQKIRGLISDFAVMIAIIIMVLIDALVGLDTPKLTVPSKVQPTNAAERGWVINPMENPWWCLPLAIAPALLGTILIFMDQQITSVIINRKEHKLQKGGGYHLDLLIIACQIAICSVIGTPFFVAATVLSINHVRSLTRESETSAPGERPKFLGIREQRVTGVLVFIMVGLSALMSKVLTFIPMSVLYGVFLFMGVASVKGIQCLQRVFIMFMPAKYQPDYVYLRHVPLNRVHLFTLCQIMCLVVLWLIKSFKQTSIVFPLMVLAMCFIRKLLDYVFTRHELKWLDDILPESHKKEKEDKKKKDKGGSTANTGDVVQVINMGEGTLMIPGKDGEMVTIPINKLRYDPKTKEVHLSENVGKSEIWNQHGAGEGLRQRPNATKNDNDKKPVTFHIDDEENGSLQGSPHIIIDPASNRNSRENISSV